MRRTRPWFGLLLATLLFGMLPMGALAAPDNPTVPGTPDVAPTASGCTYHTVRRGETLAVIAYSYGTTAWNIAALNGLNNINWIYPGQLLLIYPCGYLPPAPQPPAPPRPQCAIQPVLGFGRVWSSNAGVRAAIGCPTGNEMAVALQAQRYQSGWLWHNRTFNRWELLNSATGRWALYYDEAGARRAATQLGAALTGPFSTSGTYQLYQRGGMIWTPATGIVVFYDDGTWRSF